MRTRSLKLVSSQRFPEGYRCSSQRRVVWLDDAAGMDVQRLRSRISEYAFLSGGDGLDVQDIRGASLGMLVKIALEYPLDVPETLIPMAESIIRDHEAYIMFNSPITRYMDPQRRDDDPEPGPGGAA